MKILIVSDEENRGLWDYYTPGKLSKYDLILSCGDLKAEYLSFLVTMARCPLLYVHGNHDEHYGVKPPEGCDCIDGAIVEYNGVRFLGLGGCKRYRPGPHQYTDRQMGRRISRLKWKLRRCGGVNVIVSHAAPEGLGDREDPAHQGFASMRKLLQDYPPEYWLFGHVHLQNWEKRVRVHQGTTLINCCGTYELELPEREVPKGRTRKLIWRTKKPVE